MTFLIIWFVCGLISNLLTFQDTWLQWQDRVNLLMYGAIGLVRVLLSFRR